MQAARRLYLYAMSGITLGVVASGLVLLLRVVLDGLLPGSYDNGYNEYDGSREQLSLAIAMLGVGTPVWAIHWWLVQRGLREDRPGRDAERGSEIRAWYVTAVLAISLGVWVLSSIEVLRVIVAGALDFIPEYTSAGLVGPTTMAATAFAIWLYHGQVRRRDLGAGPVSGAAAWVPRLYLYGASIVGLFGAVMALQAVAADLLWSPPAYGVDGYGGYWFIGNVITGVGLGLVWLGHSWYATRLAADGGWRGTDERVSRMRVAAFVFIVIAAAGSTLRDVAGAIGSSIAPFVLPKDYVGDAGIAAIATPLVGATMWAVVWFMHVRALGRERAAADPLRRLHQDRLVSYGVTATAAAIGAAGASGLLGYLLDLVLGGQRTSGEFGASGYELVQWLPLAVVGIGAWLWFWPRVLRRRRLDAENEAASTIRRTFLYLTLGVALVAAIGAAALILYRFVGLLIGAGLGGNVVSEISTPLGVLVVAGAALAYHGLQLRDDQRLVAEAPAEPELVPAAAPADATPASRSRALTLVGPTDADLDAALAAARAALPPGVELVPEGE